MAVHQQNSAPDDSKETIQDRYEKAKCIYNKPQRNDTVFPHWIDEGRLFWYIRKTKNGKQFRLVNPEKKRNHVAFDHNALAVTLQENVGKTIDANDLPIKVIELSLLEQQVHFLSFQKHWAFSLGSLTCSEIKEPKKGVGSPDGENIFVPPQRIIVSQQKKGGLCT